jgi:hypothetical protein
MIVVMPFILNKKDTEPLGESKGRKHKLQEEVPTF